MERERVTDEMLKGYIDFWERDECHEWASIGRELQRWRRVEKILREGTYCGCEQTWSCYRCRCLSLIDTPPTQCR